MPRTWKYGAKLRASEANFLASCIILIGTRLWRLDPDQCYWWKQLEMAPVLDVKWSGSLMMATELVLVRCLSWLFAIWSGHFECKARLCKKNVHFCKICTWTIVSSCMECQRDSIHLITMGKQADTHCSAALIRMDGGPLDFTAGLMWAHFLLASTMLLIHMNSGVAELCIPAISKQWKMFLDIHLFKLNFYF